MRTLSEAGYLTGRQNPLNAKTRIYNVVYSDFDTQYLKAGGVGIGNEPVTYQGSEDPSQFHSIGNEAVTQKAPTGNRSVTENPMIGNRLEKNAQQNQWDASCNIFCEAVIHPVETEKINPAEAAPLARKRAFEGEPSKSVGAILGMIERKLKLGVQRSEAVKWLDWLALQINEGGHEYTSSEYQRSVRLYDELGGILDAA